MITFGADRKTCAACGAPMRERRQWLQGEVLYTWLECSREGCPSRALVKTETSEARTLRRLKPVTHAAMLM